MAEFLQRKNKQKEKFIIVTKYDENTCMVCHHSNILFHFHRVHSFIETGIFFFFYLNFSSIPVTYLQCTTDNKDEDLNGIEKVEMSQLFHCVVRCAQMYWLCRASCVGYLFLFFSATSSNLLYLLLKSDYVQISHGTVRRSFVILFFSLSLYSFGS